MKEEVAFSLCLNLSYTYFFHSFFCCSRGRHNVTHPRGLLAPGKKKTNSAASKRDLHRKRPNTAILLKPQVLDEALKVRS